jgi:hypothetical protein
MSTSVLCLMVITGMTGSDGSALRHDQDDVSARIVSATNTLMGREDSPPTMEAIVGAILELLDIAAAVTPDNQYKAEIQDRIAVAKERIRDGSIFDDKARQYLSFAYRMMTDGRKYQMPEELDDFVTPAELQEKTLRYMEGMVTRSLRALEDGDRQHTARLLLEMVLMTITPHPG